MRTRDQHFREHSRDPRKRNGRLSERGGRSRKYSPRPYFSVARQLLKVVDSLVPTAVTPVMMTTAMRAAIRPYSMAVAPDSSRTKREMRFMLVSNFSNTLGCPTPDELFSLAADIRHTKGGGLICA